MLGLIIRSFDYLGKESYLRLCKTICRPNLEYENAVWHPNIRKDIGSIKAIRSYTEQGADIHCSKTVCDCCLLPNFYRNRFAVAVVFCV